MHKRNLSLLDVYLVVFIASISASTYLFWLYTIDVAAFQINLFAAIVIVMIVGYNSIYFMKVDDGIECYILGGTHHGTYHARELRNTLNNRQQQVFDRLYHGYYGHIGDIVILPWPFCFVYRFSTTGNKLSYPASNIFTKASSDLFGDTPRVNLEAYPTLNIRFFTIRKLIPVMKEWGYKTKDLRQFRDVGDEDYHYKGSVLTQILWINLRELTLEAVRKSAVHFTWGYSGENEEDSTDIVYRKDDLEKRTLFALAQSESDIEQAGILQRPSDSFVSDYDFSDYHADLYSILSFDFMIDDLRIARGQEDDSEAAKNINNPLLGLLEAAQRGNAARGRFQELKQEGEGKKQILKELHTAGLDDKDTLAILTLFELKELQNISINQFGGDLMDLAKSFIASKQTQPPTNNQGE